MGPVGHLNRMDRRQAHAERAQDKSGRARRRRATPALFVRDASLAVLRKGFQGTYFPIWRSMAVMAMANLIFV